MEDIGITTKANRISYKLITFYVVPWFAFNVLSFVRNPLQPKRAEQRSTQLAAARHIPVIVHLSLYSLVATVAEKP